jgi:hypothetical protein
MTKLRYKIQKALFTFIGDIRYHGLLHPFWFTINAKSFRLKGKHYREVEKLIQPGDILIRRFEGYIDKFLIPGWYNHAGIYVGEIDGKPHQVIHAISDGVVVDDLIDFIKTDHMVVLRAPKEQIEKAINRAKTTIGSEYDFAFDFKETLRFSCTELVSYCYPGIIKGKKRFGRDTVVADDIVETPALKIIWTSTGIKPVGPPPPMP